MLKSKNKGWTIPYQISKKKYKKLKKGDIVLILQGHHTHELVLGKVIEKFKNVIHIIDLKEPEYRWKVPADSIIKIVTNDYPEYLV